MPLGVWIGLFLLCPSLLHVLNAWKTCCINLLIYLGLDEQNMCVCMCPCAQEPLFPARVVYDLLFYFIVIIIVLNLIFGVIIDTFADLRSEKQKKEEVLKTTCFICCKC